MKGLLLKDFYALKGFGKQYLLIFLVMVGWGAIMKNVSFVAVYIIMLGGMSVFSTLSLDESVHFNRWALTTPIGARGLIKSKYIFLTCAIGIGMGIGMLHNLLFMKLLGTGAFEWQSILILGCMMLVCFTVSLPVCFKVGVEKARFAYIFALVPLGFAAVGGFFLLEQCGIPVEAILEKNLVLFIVLLLLVSAVTVVVSYLISLRVVRNKEW